MAVEVTYKAGRWTPEVYHDLAKVDAHDAAKLVQFQLGVIGRKLFVYDVYADGERNGTVIWSVLHEPDGTRVLSINSATFQAIRGVDFVADLRAKAHELAEVLNCRSVVIWTARPGLARSLERFGLSARYVFEEEVNYGR